MHVDSKQDNLSVTKPSTFPKHNHSTSQFSQTPIKKDKDISYLDQSAENINHLKSSVDEQSLTLRNIL